MNKWIQITNYINSKEIGHIFSRKYILFLVYKNPKYRGSGYVTTADSYLKYLRNLGIIKKVDPGKYEIKYHINEKLSASKAQKLAYGGYRRWFNDVKR